MAHMTRLAISTRLVPWCSCKTPPVGDLGDLYPDTLRLRGRFDLRFHIEYGSRNTKSKLCNVSDPRRHLSHCYDDSAYHTKGKRYSIGFPVHRTSVEELRAYQCNTTQHSCRMRIAATHRLEAIRILSTDGRGLTVTPVRSRQTSPPPYS